MTEISLVECAPRDGLRLSKRDISSKEKSSFIEKLSRTGIKKIEAVSFIHPKLIAPLGDAEEVMQLVKKELGVTYVGVAPSEIACRRASLTEVDEILVLVAASDTFNQVALGYSTREMVNKILPSIFNIALNEGKGIKAYILTSFGCPYEGEIASYNVQKILSILKHMGVSEISLVDSTGMATPKSVREITLTLLEMDLEGVNLAAHFHETRGMGLANVMAAFEAGIRTFDTAIGGMSTTPFGAPYRGVTTWNIPTEDLVNMFESMGIKTGIDLDLLLDCVSATEKMLQRQLPGHILRSGKTHKLFKSPQRLKMS